MPKSPEIISVHAISSSGNIIWTYRNAFSLILFSLKYDKDTDMKCKNNLFNCASIMNISV